MSKTAISVTLDEENVTWLRGRAAAVGARGVSALLDRLVSQARAGGSPGTVRSVVGTIDVDPGDPLLEGADARIRELFDRSTTRPTVGRERRPQRGTRGRARKRGGRSRG